MNWLFMYHLETGEKFLTHISSMLVPWYHVAQFFTLQTEDQYRGY